MNKKSNSRTHLMDPELREKYYAKSKEYLEEIIKKTSEISDKESEMRSPLNAFSASAKMRKELVLKKFKIKENRSHINHE